MIRGFVLFHPQTLVKKIWDQFKIKE